MAARSDDLRLVLQFFFIILFGGFEVGDWGRDAVTATVAMWGESFTVMGEEGTMKVAEVE